MSKNRMMDVIEPVDNNKHAPSSSESSQIQKELEHIKRTIRTLKIFFLTILIIILLGLVGWLGLYKYHNHTKSIKPVPTDPIPLSIRSSVNFNVYYPIQSKLPQGYSLNPASFSTNKLAVVYEVYAPNKQKLVFSLQQKPQTSDIQSFYSRYMPLHLTVSTDIGTAAIGVINQHTIVSLPSTSNTWLLITAPLNINQGQLTQILRALQVAQ